MPTTQDKNSLLNAKDSALAAFKNIKKNVQKNANVVKKGAEELVNKIQADSKKPLKQAPNPATQTPPTTPINPQDVHNMLENLQDVLTTSGAFSESQKVMDIQEKFNQFQITAKDSVTQINAIVKELESNPDISPQAKAKFQQGAMQLEHSVKENKPADNSSNTTTQTPKKSTDHRTNFSKKFNDFTATLENAAKNFKSKVTPQAKQLKKVRAELSETDKSPESKKEPRRMGKTNLGK